MANDDEITREVESLSAMAKRIGLTGAKASQYVREHMEKLGYEAKTHVTYTKKSGGSGRRSGGFLDNFFGGSDDSEDE